MFSGTSQRFLVPCAGDQDTLTMHDLAPQHQVGYSIFEFRQPRAGQR